MHFACLLPKELPGAGGPTYSRGMNTRGGLAAFAWILGLISLLTGCSPSVRPLEHEGTVVIEDAPLLSEFRSFLEEHGFTAAESAPGAGAADLVLWTGAIRDYSLLHGDAPPGSGSAGSDSTITASGNPGLTDLGGLKQRYILGNLREEYPAPTGSGDQTPDIPALTARRNRLYSLDHPGAADNFLIPLGAYSWGVMYNRAAFSALNLEVPRSLEEFESLLLDLARRRPMAGSGNSDLSALEYPVALGSQFGWPAMAWFSYLDMRLNGPEAHEKLIFGQRRLTEAGAVRAWETLLDWSRAGVFDPRAQEKTWSQALADLEAGRGLVMLAGGFAWDRARRDLLGWFPLPYPAEVQNAAPEPRAELGQILSLAIPVGATNPEAAFLAASAYAEAGSPGLAGSTYRASPTAPGDTNPAAALSAATLTPGTLVLPSPDRWVGNAFIQQGFPVIRRAMEQPQDISAEALAAELDRLLPPAPAETQPEQGAVQSHE